MDTDAAADEVWRRDGPLVYSQDRHSLFSGPDAEPAAVIAARRMGLPRCEHRSAAKVTTAKAIVVICSPDAAFERREHAAGYGYQRPWSRTASAGGGAGAAQASRSAWDALTPHAPLIGDGDLRWQSWADTQPMSRKKLIEELLAQSHKEYCRLFQQHAGPKGKQDAREKTHPSCKACADPRPERLKAIVTASRHSTKGRIVFHYMHHHAPSVPDLSVEGRLLLNCQDSGGPLPLPLDFVHDQLSAPAMYIFDCPHGGQLIRALGDLLPDNSDQDVVAMAACGAHETLPWARLGLPVDLLTACLTSPIRVALNFYRVTSAAVISALPLSAVDLVVGRPQDGNTPLGELTTVFTAITDAIAWSSFESPVFWRLYREDGALADLFRNFLLAQRILHTFGTQATSRPSLPSTHEHHLWDLWDFTLELFLTRLAQSSPGPSLNPTMSASRGPQGQGGDAALVGLVPQTAHVTGGPTTGRRRFFEESLAAFAVSMRGPVALEAPPVELPIVLQGLLLPACRVDALHLLGSFVDLGVDAVQFTLLVGVMPYLRKILAQGDTEAAVDAAAQTLDIWTKVLCFDPPGKDTFMANDTYRHFFRLAACERLPSFRRACACVCLAIACQKGRPVQVGCLQLGVLGLVRRTLTDSIEPVLRRMMLLLLAEVCRGYPEAAHAALNGEQFAEGLLLGLDHCEPEPRASAVYAIGCILGNTEGPNDARWRWLAMAVMWKFCGEPLQDEQDELQEGTKPGEDAFGEGGGGPHTCALLNESSMLVRYELSCALAPWLECLSSHDRSTAMSMSQDSLAHDTTSPRDSIHGSSPFVVPVAAASKVERQFSQLLANDPLLEMLGHLRRSVKLHVKRPSQSFPCSLGPQQGRQLTMKKAMSDGNVARLAGAGTDVHVTLRAPTEPLIFDWTIAGLQAPSALGSLRVQAEASDDKQSDLLAADIFGSDRRVPLPRGQPDLCGAPTPFGAAPRCRWGVSAINLATGAGDCSENVAAAVRLGAGTCVGLLDGTQAESVARLCTSFRQALACQAIMIPTGPCSPYLAHVSRPRSGTSAACDGRPLQDACLKTPSDSGPRHFQPLLRLLEDAADVDVSSAELPRIALLGCAKCSKTAVECLQSLEVAALSSPKRRPKMQAALGEVCQYVGPLAARFGLDIVAEAPLLEPTIDINATDLFQSEEQDLAGVGDLLAPGAISFHPSARKCILLGRRGRIAVVDYGRPKACFPSAGGGPGAIGSGDASLSGAGAAAAGAAGRGGTSSFGCVRLLNLHRRAPDYLDPAELTQLVLMNQHCHGRGELHNSLLLCATEDGVVRVCQCWGCHNHEPVLLGAFRALPRRYNANLRISWLQNCSRLVAAGRDPLVRIWDLCHERLLQSVKHNSIHSVTCLSQCVVHEDIPDAASSVGGLIYIGRGDGSLSAIDQRTPQGVALSYNSGKLEAVASIGPAGTVSSGVSALHAAAVDARGVVDIWDVRCSRSTLSFQLGSGNLDTSGVVSQPLAGPHSQWSLTSRFAKELPPAVGDQSVGALSDLLPGRGLIGAMRLRPLAATPSTVSLVDLASGLNRLEYTLKDDVRPQALGFHPVLQTFGILGRRGRDRRFLLYIDAKL